VINTSLERGQLVISPQINTVDSKKISTIVWQKRFLIAGISCAVISVTGFLAFRGEPTYRSSMQILINSELHAKQKLSAIPENLDKNLTLMILEALDYTPEIRLMLSSKLLQKAVNLLHSQYPDLTVEQIKGENGREKALAIKKLVDPASGQVFELSFAASDPLKAQKVLQVLQKVFRDDSIEQKKYRLEKALAFVNDRLPEIKQRLKVAEEKLEKFRQKHNLFAPETQNKILLESLADIKGHLQATRAQLQDLQARQQNLQKELTSSQTSPPSSSKASLLRLQTLVNEIEKTELALAQQRQRYTDNFPSVQSLIQQRQNQVELLREEIKQFLADNKDKKSLALQQLLNKTNTSTPQTTNWEALKQSLAADTAKSLSGQEELTKKADLKQQLTDIQTVIAGLSAHQKSLEQSEQQILSELNKYPTLVSQYQSLLPEVETNRQKLKQLMHLQQFLGLQMSQLNSDLQVLEEPQPGVYAVKDKLLFLLGGAIAAPIIGLAAALVWGLSNNVIYSSQELQKLTNLPLLATVPKLRSPLHWLSLWRFVRKPRCIAINSPVAEIFAQKPVPVYSTWPFHQTLDMAYQNLEIVKSPLSFKSLMITSARSQEGKTTLALGLAVSAARMHRRVLLIDANLHQPKLHKVLALSNDWGLSLLLVDEANTCFRDYIQPIHPSIDVLTAGSATEDTVKLLSSQRMKELLKTFECTYDLVLIDAPAILSMVDARILATFCNSIVMVAHLGRVTATEVIQATSILSNLNLIGIIANAASTS